MFMSDYSTRYFQLTSDILIEYNYASESGTDGKIEVNNLGINSIVTTQTPYLKHYLINKNYRDINLSTSNFVVPSNSSQTSFIKLLHKVGIKNTFSAPSSSTISINSFEYNTEGNTYTMDFDKIRFHFTSKNFFGDYEGLIFQTYVYDKQKNKICLMSFRLSKTDNLTINDNPMLINQRYYTSYIEVKIPSVYKILKSYNSEFGTGKDGNSVVYETLENQLGIFKSNSQLMTNTPINFNLFGIKTEIVKNTYTYYLTENIASVSIPSKDSYDSLYVDISEAKDGDYFNIQTKVSDGTSFSDYMYSMGDNLNSFVIMHELRLIEHWVTYNNTLRDTVTHVEQYMVNAMTTYTDEHDQVVTVVNEEALDDAMTYRPICKYGSRCFKFTIEDTLKIINTTDGTTIIKSGSYDYDKPSRYGKKMNQINLTEVPSIINVYNKRTDSELDTDTNVIRITNGNGSGTKIETNVQNITSFIEGTNIVVSIQQIPAIDAENMER